MRSKIFLYILLALIFGSLLSCSNRAVPAGLNSKAGVEFDAATFNYFYVEALKQKLMGNAGDALKYLEQCVKINPESDAAFFQMSQIVIASGDVRNGKKYLLKALSVNENNIWYLSILGGLYYQEKNIDSAIIYYEKAVKFYPEKENLILTLGNLYSESKKYEKAALIFDSFDSKYGVNEMSTLSAVRNLMAENKYTEALTKIKVLLAEFPDEVVYNGLLADIYGGLGDKQKALDIYSDILKKNPDNGQIQLALCDFLINENHYEELFRLISDVILNNKIEVENKISLMARIIEIPGINKYNDKLITALILLEANYNKNDIIPLLRPDYLIRVGNLGEAANRLEEIITGNGDNYYAWEKLLVVYLQMKDYNKLYKVGEECATRFNRSFPAKLLFANGALELRKYEIALDELKKAEILATDNKESLIQVLTMRADVYYRMKDYLKAFETFEVAIKEDNEDLTIINNYAYYLAEQNKNLKEAEQMAKRVIEKEKDNTTFLDTYGWVLYKRGKLQEAAKVMESIISKGDKTDAVWYEHYGYILKKQKKCEEAVKVWNIALKIDSTKTDLLKEIENCKK